MTQKQWSEEPELTPHPSYGDLIPLDDFLECVKDGFFIDYDGWCDLATETQYDPDMTISPSDIGSKEIPKWVTHVVWYNK